MPGEKLLTGRRVAAAGEFEQSLGIQVAQGRHCDHLLRTTLRNRHKVHREIAYQSPPIRKS
jgi:hypothetical protein